MELLIDYLEDAATYIRERKVQLRKFDTQYRKTFDEDIKKEMHALETEMMKKRKEVTYELLLNLDEFQSLKRYFPELFEAFLEDPDIGEVLAKKSWLLERPNLPPKMAADKLGQIQKWRERLKDVGIHLKGKGGLIDTGPLLERYPFLEGYVSGKMTRDDIDLAIKKLDQSLIREGWLVLISDELIEIPAKKFMTEALKYSYEETKARTDMEKARGRGTTAEVGALRRLEKAQKRRAHYENILSQLLLANPGYLRRLKASKQWLSRKGSNSLVKFASTVTPHMIKEMSWLKEMERRIAQMEKK